MFSSEYIDFLKSLQESLDESSSDKTSVDTPKDSPQEIGSFRAINASSFREIQEIKAILLSFQNVCIIPEKIAEKYQITNGDYYQVSTSEKLSQNQTRGSEIEFCGERDYLIKFLTCPSPEKIDKLCDVVLLPDLVFYNLGITKNSYVTIRRLGEQINDKVLDTWKTRKDFPLKPPKKITCKALVNKYQKYITPVLIHTLLKEKQNRIIHHQEIIVLNFFDKINDDLFLKLNKAHASKFLRLNAEKSFTPKENFLIIIKVKDIEPLSEAKQGNTQAPAQPSNAFLFDSSQINITLEAPYNMFLPVRRLPITNNFPEEFLEKIWKNSYVHKSLKILKNVFDHAIKNQSSFSQSKLFVTMSYPPGAGLSLLLKHSASKFGFNFIEKKVSECYSLQEFEKAIVKGIKNRPSVVLFKGFLHLKTFLNQKASISHSNSLESYLQHLSNLIKETSLQASDNLPCLIILAENNKEKVEQVYSEVSEVFNFGLHILPPSDEEHAGVLLSLLKWFSVTIDDSDELGSLTKGLSWKQLYKILSEQRERKEDDQFKVQDFRKKIEQVKKKSNVANSLNIPNVTWDDVGGLREAKDEIIDTIMLPQYYPQLFQNKIKPRTGILFFGPPGTGKTMLAKAVATECKMNFMSVKGPELLNMYVGESEKNVREIFDKARSNLPCIIFFDELDALVPNRGKGSDSSQVMDRIVAQFLTEIDGLQKEGGLFIIGATNRPDLLDPSLLRPGRFDKMVYLGINEDQDSRIKILEAQTRKFHLKKDVDFAKLETEIPKNFTGADFYALTSGAILTSVKRKIEEVNQRFHEERSKGKSDKTFEEWSRDLGKEDLDVEVGHHDFMETLRGITPSVSVKELEKYKELKNKYALE